MLQTRMAMPLIAAILSAALAIGPVMAKSKSSSKSHSSSSHSSASHKSSSHAAKPKKAHKPNPNTWLVERACKTKACLRKHPGGSYYEREKVGPPR